MKTASFDNSRCRYPPYLQKTITICASNAVQFHALGCLCYAHKSPVLRFYSSRQYLVGVVDWWRIWQQARKFIPFWMFWGNRWYVFVETSAWCV